MLNTTKTNLFINILCDTIYYIQYSCCNINYNFKFKNFKVTDLIMKYTILAKAKSENHFLITYRKRY